MSNASSILKTMRFYTFLPSNFSSSRAIPKRVESFASLLPRLKKKKRQNNNNNDNNNKFVFRRNASI